MEKIKYYNPLFSKTTDEELDKGIYHLLDDIQFLCRKANWEELNRKDKEILSKHLTTIWYLLGECYN